MKNILALSQMHSIRVKLLLYFFIISLVSTYLMGISLISMSRYIFQKQVEKRLVTISDLKISQIRRLMHTYKTDIATLADGNATFLEIIQQMTSEEDTTAVQELQNAFQLFLLRNSPFTEIFLLHPKTGSVIFSTDPSNTGKMKNADSYFLEGRYEAFAKNIYYSWKENQSSTIVSAPVRNKATGKLLAVIAGRVKLFSIDTLLNDASGLGNTGKTYITNPVHFVMEDPNLSDRETLRIQNFISTIGTDEALKGKTGTEQYQGVDGKEVIGHFQYLADLGIIFIAEQDIEEAFSALATLRNQFFIAIFLVVALASLVVYFISRKFAEPIETLDAAARKIAQGHLDYKAHVPSHDEIGKLASSFNIMAKKLKNSYGALEKKVHLKTRELAHKVQEIRKFQLAVDAATDGIVITDVNQKIVYVNSAFEHLTGHTFAMLRGKSLDILQSENTDKETFETLWRTLKRGKSHSFEDVLYKRPDGTHYHTEISFYPLKIQGKIGFFVGLFQDVTKRAEVNHMKDDFISLVSHQLRTPLSAIKGFIELMESKKTGILNTSQKDFLKDIKASNERMIELVNALLNISRIESGRITVEPQMVNIEILSQKILELFRTNINAKNLHIQHTCDPLPRVHVDPELLSEIFSNLISNAIKYTPKNGRISLKIFKKGPYIISEIQDTGYGIPKMQQKSVFTKFFRAENISTIDTDGTGLGLYITKSLVELLGGKIWFKSTANAGSLFTFSIPLQHPVKKSKKVSLNKT